jgi:hypothetical protein
MCYNARMDYSPLNDKDKQVLHDWAVERYQRLMDVRRQIGHPTASYDEWLEELYPYVSARLYYECFSRLTAPTSYPEVENWDHERCWRVVVEFCRLLDKMVGSDDYLMVPIHDLIELFVTRKGVTSHGTLFDRGAIELLPKSRSIRWRVRT